MVDVELAANPFGGTKMNKLLLAGFSSLALMVAGTANAADMAVPAYKAPPPVAPAFSWTGCYLGINAGGGMHNSDFIAETAAWENIGAVAGGQVGCNYQIRQFVVGVEGEFDWAGLNSKSSFIDPTSENFSSTANNKYDATVALRMGYAFDRLLAYGKLGAAWGKFNWTSTETDFPGVGCECTSTESAARTLMGLLFGFGFEYALTDQWTAKVEYNYINYGNATANFTTTCSPAVFCGGFETSFTDTEREAVQTFKVGANFKFN
jgi:outer membrane immunogenic protein